VQLSASGQVQQTFQAQVVPRQYDQVWTQKLSYGGSGGTGVINVGANVSPESTICHTIVGGTTTAESISRVNTTGIQVGPSAGVDVVYRSRPLRFRFQEEAELLQAPNCPVQLWRVRLTPSLIRTALIRDRTQSNCTLIWGTYLPQRPVRRWPFMPMRKDD